MMPPTGKPVSAGRSRATGIVLAGGRSSRMGQPKALLPFNGEPLIVHVVATLRRVFGEVVVVAAPDQELPQLPVTLVHDDVAYQGPVGGIAYGLNAATGEAAFITSCDSVFLNPTLIEHLVSQISGYDVVVPLWEGRYQPLHAVYRRTVLPLVTAQLERGERRPVTLFDRVRTRTVHEDEIRRFDPDGASMFNMNTPQDYEEALSRWPRLQPPRPGPGDPVECTVELFGVARMTAHTARLALTLPAGATLTHVFAALAERLPALKGRVIAGDSPRLVDGYACNINGYAFIRTPDAPVSSGDSIVILSADAGG